MEIFSLIPTCVEDTSKDPALAISHGLLRTVILQENVHTSRPGWRCNTVSIRVVPGSSNHTIIILGVDLKTKETSIRDVRDWIIKSSLTQQTQIRRERLNIAMFRLKIRQKCLILKAGDEENNLAEGHSFFITKKFWVKFRYSKIMVKLNHHNEYPRCQFSKFY